MHAGSTGEAGEEEERGGEAAGSRGKAEKSRREAEDSTREAEQVFRVKKLVGLPPQLELLAHFHYAW